MNFFGLLVLSDTTIAHVQFSEMSAGLRGSKRRIVPVYFDVKFSTCYAKGVQVGRSDIDQVSGPHLLNSREHSYLDSQPASGPGRPSLRPSCHPQQ